MASIESVSNIELAVMLGMDAFRIAIGLPPKNFAPELVADGIRICAERCAASRSIDSGKGRG